MPLGDVYEKLLYQGVDDFLGEFIYSQGSRESLGVVNQESDCVDDQCVFFEQGEGLAEQIIGIWGLELIQLLGERAVVLKDGAYILVDWVLAQSSLEV